MPIGTLHGIRDVRERLLGYHLATVARITGIDAERLRAIEGGDAEPSVFEIEALSSLYGIEADLLVERPIRIAPGDAVEMLASLDEFREVSDPVRVRIIAAANAARDLMRLRRLLGADTRAEIPRLAHIAPDLPPHRQGTKAANAFRKMVGLRSEPIPSVRDVVKQLNWVDLLYADLGADGPAGVTFADQVRGTVIVLNLNGKNRNPCVRRFSLAHELCHLLQDRRRGEPLAVVSGYRTDAVLPIEQRANAFAVRFLCPESVVRGGLPADSLEAAQELMAVYGLHYAAAALYLRNERSDRLPPIPPPSLRTLGTESRWETAEEPDGLLGFPLVATPPERRAVVAVAAAQAYSRGLIPRDSFARALGVTPAEQVEQVLDFFALPLPGDAEEAA